MTNTMTKTFKRMTKRANTFERMTHDSEKRRVNNTRQAVLGAVKTALKEKNLPHAYVIGFKGSYAMNLQSNHSDVDVLVYVKADIKQELLLGNRPLSKEFAIEATDDHPKIEVNVQSVTHLTRSLHKIPFNTVEVFAGVMAPEYDTTVNSGQFESEGELIAKHIQNVLSTTQALNQYKKTLFFMGQNTFKKFSTLNKQWQESSDPTRNNVNDARHKAFAKAVLFHRMLTNDRNESIVDFMRIGENNIRLYHECRCNLVNEQMRKELKAFYNDEDSMASYIKQPNDLSPEYKKAMSYFLTLI